MEIYQFRVVMELLTTRCTQMILESCLSSIHFRTEYALEWFISCNTNKYDWDILLATVCVCVCVNASDRNLVCMEYMRVRELSILLGTVCNYWQGSYPFKMWGLNQKITLEKFLPKCLCTCTSSVSIWLNVALHRWHLYLFSPGW
jgi:hypothetical protein